MPLRTLFLLLAILPQFGISNDTVRVDTFVYKTVGDLDIKLDVHRRNDDQTSPVAVWCHGGALINGGREGIGRSGRELVEAGYCVVSIDYRLAPETKLPGIIADLEDAFRWIRENGKEKFNGDTRKIAVLGGSAGGYLAMTAGFRIQPRVDCIVAFWGYGDLVGPWMSEPSPHPGHQRKSLSPEEMHAVESGPPLANAADRALDGQAYYQTCRQTGTWTERVTGFDPETGAEKIAPYMAAVNVDADYPPILMIHGTRDTDVPHEQSAILARECAKNGVEHQLISIENGEHGLRDASPDDIETAYARVLPFIARYVAPPES
ncbi:MAG: alpha/beta hydrolase [Verrucomicrobiales bacterium]|nr:alpha/beta hydrolase [Verrucomicrobiales bacterium]